MRRVLLILMVTCLLIPTGKALGASAREIQDVGRANFDDFTWQWFDNRNNHSNVPQVTWLNTSKGDYFVLDAMVITGGYLSSFNNIIEVTANPSDAAYSTYTFPLIRFEACDTLFGEPKKEFYLFLRYSPWMQASTWTYTLKYTGTDRKVHIQKIQRSGVSVYTTPPINTVYLDSTIFSWLGIGPPNATTDNYVATYELRRYDSNGCLSDRWYLDGNYYNSVNGMLSVYLGAFDSGTVLRVENRKNLPGYGLTAKSVYIFQVP